MSFNFVRPKRHLKLKIKVTKIGNELKEEFKDLSVAELQDMRLNPELIKYICNTVETRIKKKYKANKKDIVIGIIFKLIPSLTELEKKAIGETIEFLHGNNDIKTITVLRYCGRFLVDQLKKKVSE